MPSFFVSNKAYYLDSDISGVHSFISGLFSFLFFLDFTNRNIQTAATTKQHIHTIGLAASHANHIVTNHTVIVRAKDINPVQNQIILDKNGITFANVSMNLSIVANPENINSNPTNLRIHVIILFACCACRNISAAVTLPCSNRAIFLQFETV